MLRKRRVKGTYIIFILITYMVLLFGLTTNAVGVAGENITNKDAENISLSKDELVVITPHANIRSEPSGSSSKIGFAKEGDKLIKLGKKGNWYNVQLKDNKTGWIYKTLVKEETTINKESEKGLRPKAKVVEKKEIVSLPKGELVVITSYANIRSEPSTSSAKIGSVKKGSRLPKLGEKGNWYKIRFENKKTGWIFKKLVKEQVKISRDLVKDLYPKVQSIMGNYDYKKAKDSYFKAKGWYPSFQFIHRDKDIEVEKIEDNYSVLVNVYQDKKDIETKTFQDEINYLYLSNTDKSFFQLIVLAVLDEDPKINKAGVNLWFAHLNVLGELEWRKVGTIVKRRAFAEEIPLIELPADEFWSSLDENTIEKDLWK